MTMINSPIAPARLTHIMNVVPFASSTRAVEICVDASKPLGSFSSKTEAIAAAHSSDAAAAAVILGSRGPSYGGLQESSSYTLYAALNGSGDAPLNVASLGRQAGFVTPGNIRVNAIVVSPAGTIEL